MMAARGKWLVKSRLANERRRIDAERIEMVRQIIHETTGMLRVIANNLDQQAMALERRSIRSG